MDQLLIQAENLGKQLEELEMLQSIYPGRGEVVVDDHSVVSDARNFVAQCGDSGVILKLSYSVNVSCVEVTIGCNLSVRLKTKNGDHDILLYSGTSIPIWL